MVIEAKRVYVKPSKVDGARILVDRLWPRGLEKKDAHLDDWLRDIAPSSAIGKRFGHNPARWREFKNRYSKELDGKSDEVEKILGRARRANVTLLFAAKNEENNNAVALKEYLKKKSADQSFLSLRSLIASS